MPIEIRSEDAVAVRPFDRLEGSRLTVLLHGYGSHERDLLPIAEAAPADDVVVSLRAPVAAGPGFAWVDGPPEVVLSGAGLDLVADAVLRWLDAVAATAGAPEAVRLLGFSQGGALALTLLRRAPSRFERVVVLAGFVPAGAEAGDAALAVQPPPVLWIRGDADWVIPPDTIDRTTRFLGTHADATVLVLPGLGHGVDERALDHVRRFLRGSGPFRRRAAD